jgi:hypothetical protein
MSTRGKGANAAAPFRTATLCLSSTGETLTASFLNHETYEELAWKELGITRTMLADELVRIAHLLSPVIGNTIWSAFADPLAKPRTTRQKQALARCLEQVVSAGSALFHSLSEDLHFGNVLRKVEKLQPGSVLTVRTNVGSLPWEILYPLAYSADWPAEQKKGKLRRRQLWGARFTIESIILRDGEDLKPPLAAHRSGTSFVSLNLNPTIDEKLQDCPFKPRDYHQRFYQSYLHDGRGELRTQGDEIKQLLLSKDCQATILYLYCHGSNARPFSQYEELELDRGAIIGPDFLNGSSAFLRAPIVILNSCSSGAYSPLSFSTFLSKFRAKRALGLVGTSFPIPATFAAAFGGELIKRYLERVPIGKALFDLRRDLLDKGNPLGLLYTLQCHMHITAP